jgi:predicted ATPase
LRKESQLIPQGKRVSFFDERGIGLPGIYQAILGRGDDAFTNIRDAVRKLFPTVKLLRVTPRTENTLSLETELQYGTTVPPQFMSDGLLYYLAFAAIPFVTSVRVLVVEEPENGLHPARIRDVVGMLRKFAEDSGTQVLMATHSPLVINELQPEEVTVVTRDPQKGTQVTPIANTPNFERRAKTAALGELWLSYADGAQETPLLVGRSAAS